MANKQALKEINEHLRSSLENILGCLMAVKGSLFLGGTAGSTTKSRQLDPETPWPDGYSTVGQLPKVWLSAFLQRIEPAFSDRVLERVNKADCESVRRLIFMGMGLHAGSPLPQECLCKRICTEWMEKLYDVLGKRFEGQWVDKFVGENGQINWQLGGVYKFQPEPEDSSMKLSHIGGHSGAPELLVLSDGDSEIKFNWSDWDAEFGDMEVKCRKCLSDKGAAFEEYLSDDYQKALAKSCARKATEAKTKYVSQNVVVAETTQKAVTPVKNSRPRRSRPAGRCRRNPARSPP